MAMAKYTPRPVATRIPPAPVASTISVRQLPPASYASIIRACNHWLAKAAGDYKSPASRALFELAHEVKALLGPLRDEELRLQTRLKHLEALMLQWTEVFGEPCTGDLESPAALASALREQKATNERLREEVAAARSEAAATEARCLETLRQHHSAHTLDLERVERRHAEEMAQLRSLHAALLQRA